MSSGGTEYCFVSGAEAPLVPVPKDKRVSFGLDTITVLPSGTLTRLTWTDEPLMVESRFRVMVALDVREEVLIEVLLLENEQVIGRLDIRYAYVCQPFELLLTAEQTAAAVRGGVGLRMIQGTQALWLFNAVVPNTSLYRPHLLTHVERECLQQFYQRLASLDSVQPFGWMEGCVLDGLLDLRHTDTSLTFTTALINHLQQFLDAKQQLIYEDPRSRPSDNHIYGIEATLPFAALAVMWPEHGTVDHFLAFVRVHLTDEGAIQDGETLSTEGSYTIAYPLAVIAWQRADAQLAKLALRQLSLRRDYLVHEDGLYLRYHADGQRTFRNWARGCAWYMLGLARTLNYLPDYPESAELKTEFQRVAAWIKDFVHADGLWSCFVDDKTVAVDTSGSAGIAAAFAIGANSGLLEGHYRLLAAQTFATLQTCLTPDGFLLGVAQANRGGEALQRSDYRVISQMGMGLMGQLGAALES